MRPASPSANQNFQDNRLLLVWGFLMVAACGLLIKLFAVQIIEGKALKRKAEANQRTSQRPFLPRRPIVDRDGTILAADQPSCTLYAHPDLFKTLMPAKGKEKAQVRNIPKEEVATALAPILKIPAQQLLDKFKKPHGIFLGKRLSLDVCNRVDELKNDGLDTQRQKQDYRRVYPQAEMATEILGYVDYGYQAKAGVELSQDKLLRRQMQEFTVSRSGNGGILPDQVSEESLRHDDLRLKLTVDLRLQQVARQALKTQLAQWKGKRGTVMVMDADTGALRAMVVEPTFDPNNFSMASKERLLKSNWAVTDIYEPGSTFKPINVAIALENKIVTPSTMFNDTGAITIGINTVKNAGNKAYGQINPAQILQHSSNVGMVKMMQGLSPAVYYNWLERLEINHRVGINLPDEARGILKSRQKFMSMPIESAAASFGQGLAVTPLQLLTMVSTLANGGKLVTPYVVEGLFDSTGLRQDAPKRPAPRQLFTESTANQVLEMMQLVVDAGTGHNAQVRGFKIAGKTGTAQQSGSGRGYKAGNIVSFIGILPVDKPHRYVVFAAVDSPQEGAAGGTVAAPIVKKVMETLISVEGIIPVNGQVPPPSSTTPPKN